MAGPVAAHASSTLTVAPKGGIGDLESITTSFDGTGGGPQKVLAGTLTESVNGGPSFDGYCVDLYHVVQLGSNGTSSYVVTPLPIASLSGGNGAGVGYLYHEFASTIANESSGAARNIDGAALQVALWKVEYDNGGALGSGHFAMADSGNTNSVQHLVFARATQYLSTYDGSQSADATWYQAVSHPSSNGFSMNQNMIGPPPSGPPVPTPEPGTIVMAALGAAGLLIHARRRGRPSPA